MQNTITLKNIAIEAGYSISTVSKALNDSHEISNITKEKIRKIASSLNYIPNFFARNLKSKKNFIIGVIIPDFKNEFFYNLVNGITEETSDNSHRVMVYQTCNSPRKEINYINLLSEDIIDGLIVCTSFYSEKYLDDNKNYFNFSQKNTPFTIVNKKNKESIMTEKAKEYAVKYGKTLVNDLIVRIKQNNIQLKAS
ncbi:LacI family DNA-binding transcriptional regulator [Tenacibaculum ovolyticum]|uniref:LacI family DNA-binding transcriptional regulator n=1 Tax=Tenacibaculum ovolyticum TaxID=104270 RepID=UPI003BAC3B27